MKYYETGMKAEKEFCALMEDYGGAYLNTSMVQQNKDIDCTIRKDKRTVSVKEQHSADKFNMFLFEYKQIRTRDLETIDGNFISCEADLYAIATPSSWYIFDASKLKEYVNSNNWSTVYTTAYTESLNRKYKGMQGYDRTMSYKVPIKSLVNNGCFLYKCKRK